MYVINEKSQDSTAKHLSNDGLLHYHIIHCAGERIFLLVNILANSYRQNPCSSGVPVSSSVYDISQRHIVFKRLNGSRSFLTQGLSLFSAVGFSYFSKGIRYLQ